MKFISIFISLLFINTSCSKQGTAPADEIDDAETNDSICTNCIWLQNSCNDNNWFIGYNTDIPIGGFQFNIDGVLINSSSAGNATEAAGFTVQSNGNTTLGFSLSGATVSGEGILATFYLQGNPSGLSNIIISDSIGNTLDNISYYGIVGCYYSSLLENTGESQLTILNNSISNLEIGDQIGIFDLSGIINYNDCSNQIGEVLVGSGVWDGEQLNIVSIGSVDLCALEGVQLSGFVEGNPLIMKIYRPGNEKNYLANISWEVGSGYFGELIQSISNITLTQLN